MKRKITLLVAVAAVAIAGGLLCGQAEADDLPDIYLPASGGLITLPAICPSGQQVISGGGTVNGIFLGFDADYTAISFNVFANSSLLTTSGGAVIQCAGYADGLVVQSAFTYHICQDGTVEKCLVMHRRSHFHFYNPNNKTGGGVRG